MDGRGEQEQFRGKVGATRTIGNNVEAREDLVIANAAAQLIS